MSIINSKLPQVGTTIFSVMSQMANEHNAINLSQGFPDYEIDPILLERVNHYNNLNYHQYAPSNGILPLRNAIQNIYTNVLHTKYDTDNEILITSGASEALFSALAAIIHKGDEVVVFEPAYDLYIPAIQLFGGIPITIPTYAPNYSIDWNVVNQKINNQTKCIIINNPNNPTGKMWTTEDFAALEQIIEKHPHLLILSDEVYGFITLSDKKFISVSQSDVLKPRSIITCSFGKLLHTTGWKIGYCLAPKTIMDEIKKVHQFNVFTVNHALQYAIADYISKQNILQDLNSFFIPKYIFLKEQLQHLGFEVLDSDATYFLSAKYTKISNKSDVDFAKYLVEKYKVATIPVSAFYQNKYDDQIIRFCFAKKDETLKEAINNLRHLI